MSQSSALDPTLYTQLERAVIQAREVAEAGATDALRRLGLHLQPAEAARQPGVDVQSDLHARLRAHKKAVGGFEALVSECAYEFWHRMLFARILAENHLLMHPDGVAVTLDDCNQLAPMEDAPDGWTLASRYAARMLPQLFRPDDPLLHVNFAPEHLLALERLLMRLPVEVFTSDDGLGWMYQFWQSKRKDEVNESGRKIGGGDLSAVTQLFTEDYMVRFLLDNTLGAWVASGFRFQVPGSQVKSLPSNRQSPIANHQSLFSFLRFREDGQPAAGTFPGWPKRAGELRIMDPCCGSGHFLVAAFNMLVPMRMAEDGLSEAEAADAVLRDNLFGLELDPRCAQIAVFALALAAWKRGGYRPLPPLNVACSGVAPNATEKEWLALAGKDPNLRLGMRLLYDQFKDAETLGSLINPRKLQNIAVNFHDMRELLAKALAESPHPDPLPLGEGVELGVMAQGIAKAAELLAGEYHLVATNVPYLGRGKQDERLREFCESVYPAAKADLATAFVERCLELCAEGGTSALVTPQNWLFLGSYKRLREKLLREETWNLVARLGPGAFRTISGEVVNVALIVLTRGTAPEGHELSGLDASAPRDPDEKARLLQTADVQRASQAGQLRNPDARVVFEDSTIAPTLLSEFADVFQGISTTDAPRFVVRFWEIPGITAMWQMFQLAPEAEGFHGYSALLRWESGRGELAKIGTAQKGLKAQGKHGFAVAVTRSLMFSFYLGTRFDGTIAVIVPKSEDYREAIGCYLSSVEYKFDVRKVDKALSVTESSFLKVPFDLAHWQQVASERYPNGLPEPHSDDPTQWLFKGNIVGSTTPLQVAVAKLLGDCWPEEDDGRQTTDDADGRLSSVVHRLADADGIVCLPAVGGERPAHERLRDLLAAAYGEAWNAKTLDELLANAYAGNGRGDRPVTPATRRTATLETWLRDDFFDQHCKLFHQRPFIWHIWDGRKDGFAALVNYHKLDHKLLERLTYTYLGDWIARQRDGVRRDEAGAEERLRAAMALQGKLKLILQGEPPYDIYVRWKPLHQQPMGWQPDLNDGVRMNIRPFVIADVLRKKPTINWNKDRGKNPDGSERLNDLHFTLAEKQKARAARGDMT